MARRAKIKDKNKQFEDTKEERLLYELWQQLIKMNGETVVQPNLLSKEVQQSPTFKDFLAARESVYHKHKWLIRKSIKRNSGCAFDIASDSEQEAALFFLRYAHRFNPYVERTFSSYITRVLNGGVLEAFYQVVYTVRRSSYLSLIKNKIEKTMAKDNVNFDQACDKLKVSTDMRRLAKVVKFHRNEYASCEAHLNRQVEREFDDNYTRIWIDALLKEPQLIAERLEKLPLDAGDRKQIMTWIENKFEFVDTKRFNDIIKKIT
jgi:hypothetical protein